MGTFMREKTGLKRKIEGLPKQLLLIAFGSLLFSAALNQIVLPLGMYCGGFLGISQLLCKGIYYLLPSLHGAADLAGLIYFLLNIPLLILAFSSLGRTFFIKTVFCVSCYSLFLSVLPIPNTGLLDDQLTACILGGLVCGAGAGITLTAGCSGGGEEIVGLLCAQRWPWFSVGKAAMFLNIAVFGIGLFIFEQSIVIYSIIFACVCYYCLDRSHLQNVMVAMFIITKKPEMEQWIFEHVGRGITKWKGAGAYSGEDAEILLTVLSKKEALTLKANLQIHDPDVFVLICQDISILGNFQKRL